MKTLPQLGDQGIVSCFILLFKGYRKLHSLGMWYSPPRMQSRRTICLGGCFWKTDSPVSRSVAHSDFLPIPGCFASHMTCPPWKKSKHMNIQTANFSDLFQRQARSPLKMLVIFFQGIWIPRLRKWSWSKLPKRKPRGRKLISQGITALGYAVWAGHLATTKVLIEYGAPDKPPWRSGGVLRSFILLAKRANLTKNFWGLHIRKNKV